MRRLLGVILVLFVGCGGCDGDSQKNNDNNQAVSCGEANCSDDATCDDSGDSAVCTCKPGFAGNGKICTELVTSCEDDVDCGNGVCEDGECACNEGFAPDGTSCADADECATGTHDCDERATCSNTEGSFVCTCGAGWTGDGFTCLDFDECAAGADDCSAPNTECSNTEGGFECVCGPGYTGDGETCSILADCENDPSACDDDATCTDTPDGTACICNDGFRGDGASCRESGFAHLAAAADGTCAMRRDRTVACWGYGIPTMRTSGLVIDAIAESPVDEPSGALWTQLAGGTGRWCGVQVGGTLWCSGFQGFVQVGTDAGWESVSPQNGFAFDQSACAIKTDGTLWCWGEGPVVSVTGMPESELPVPVGTDTDWATVQVAEDYACAIKDDGSLWCWGSNDSGTVSPDGQSTEGELMRYGTATDWASLHLSRDVACGLKTNGESWCWGGRSSQDELRRLGTSTWKSYSVDGLTARWCGVKTDGTLWCYGTNLWGERGQDTYDYGNTLNDEPAQVGTAKDWVQVTAAAGHTCARKANNDTYCFGHNMLGQLGKGTHGFKFTPTPVEAGSSFKTVALGQAHMCAVTNGGDLHCTGSNIAGHLGIEEVGLIHVQRLTRAGSASNWKNVAAGIQHTCGTRNDGTLWCAGFNGGGQLGLGEGTFQMTPGFSRVGQASNWSSVTAAPTWTCGATQTGQASCWGTNDGGQIGDGGIEWAYTPKQVGTATYKQIATGGNQIQRGHTCAIAMDDTLWCWGFNQQGQLGLGTVTPMEEEPMGSTPQQVGSAKWKYVDAGADYTCGIQMDDSLWCWGGRAAGRLGLGTAAGVDPISSPQRVGAANDWGMVSTGFTTTCGVKTNNTLWCWGDASAGVLGLGEVDIMNIQVWEPVRVGTANNWAYVDTDYTSTCGLKLDGSLFCWGINRDGQLGTGDAWFHEPQLVRE